MTKNKSVQQLNSLPNIGNDTCKRLQQVGINTPQDLQLVGTEQAFLRLQTLDPGACIQLLYGLEGALQGIPSSALTKERKQELLEFHRMTKINRL